MPVVVKVNVSRKLSKDFQSQGYGLEVQCELPHGVIENADAMAEATANLFTLAEELLNEQVHKAQGEGGDATPTANGSHEPAPTGGNGRAGGSGASGGSGGGNGDGRNGQAYPPHSGQSANGPVRGGERGGFRGEARGRGRGITEAQAKAIESIAKRINESPDRIAQDEFGKNLRELSIREASTLIDNLKKEMAAPQTAGAGR